VRRSITIPLYLLLFGASVATSPLLFSGTLLGDLVLRSRFALTRALAFFVWYLGCETLGLAAAAGAWLAARVLRPSPERYLEWNFRLKCWWARQLMRGARICFGLRFEVENAEVVVPGPVLLLMRHASTADTILTTALLSDRFGIEFRHVIKRELLWDPCLDVVGLRLRNCFVDRSSEDSAREIAAVAALARDLGSDGVLIYPEGTRFTARKQARVLEKLGGQGEIALLERARALRHVLPPRLGGPLSLLQASPGSDVVFCAHVGFDGIRSFSDFLRGGLVGQTVRVAYWRIPASQVPADRDAQIEWLLDEWQRVDAWIAADGKVPA
jgi:1-acyl-sn-glycerol-3-phosphate acyltransferase